MPGVATPAKAAPRAPESAEDTYARGDLIADKYRLTRVLGEGGMGAVWEADDTTLHTRVAIKLIRRDIASEEASVRLLREARAAAQLNHPTIVRVHGFGETEHNDPFIVMELLEGESLQDILDSRGSVESTAAVQMLLPVLAGLQCAHEKEIVHRDLKPDNIILVSAASSGETTPKIVDFGVAKLRHEAVEDVQRDSSANIELAKRITQVGALLGSPHYMSPEHIAYHEVDRRADLWSVSVILYQLLTGSLPFEAEDYETLLVTVLSREPDPHEIEPTLWKILARGLEKRPDDRWQSAQQMGEALAGWLLEQGTQSDITGRLLHTQWLNLPVPVVRGGAPPPPPRNRALYVAGGIAVVATLGALLLLFADEPSSSDTPAARAAPESPSSPAPAQTASASVVSNKPDEAAPAEPANTGNAPTPVAIPLPPPPRVRPKVAPPPKPRAEPKPQPKPEHGSLRKRIEAGF